MNAAADRLERQQEIIADIAFTCGAYWNRMSEKARDVVSEHTEGSRGMMAMFIEWAGEFDAMWIALDEDDDRRENYIGEVDDFAHQKMNVLVAECRLS